MSLVADRISRRLSALLLPAVAAVCSAPWVVVTAATAGLAPVAAAAAPAHATHVATTPSAATPLDAYLDGLTTLRGSFLQTLVDPQGKEIDRATGTLIVMRPGKFSWEIHPQGTAAGTQMVADGRNVWFLDRDLAQVTVKPADSALSATPAMLLSGTVNLRKSFTVTAAGPREGLDWVLVEPKAAQADFRTAAFGFEHGALKSLKLEDKLGQVATIQFQGLQRNGPVAPSEVSFTPPPGTDVIGKPR